MKLIPLLLVNVSSWNGNMQFRGKMSLNTEMEANILTLAINFSYVHRNLGAYYKISLTYI